MTDTQVAERVEPSLAIKPSELLPLIKSLPRHQQRILGCDEFQIEFASILFAGLQVWLDESDPRPIYEKLEFLEHRFDACIRLYSEDSFEEDESGRFLVPKWLRLVRDRNVRRVTLQLLGSAKFHRLREAWRADAKIFVLAGRRLVRNLLYVAGAIDSCVEVLTPAQIDGMSTAIQNFKAHSALRLVVNLDSALDDLENQGIFLDQALARKSELEPIASSYGRIEEKVDALLRHEFDQVLDQLDDQLARKARGARDALQWSSDPVSQAAHSLVELIDRTLRAAFEDDDVLAWLEGTEYDSQDLTYMNADGLTAPTKAAEALCFAFAGSSISDPEGRYLFDLAAHTLARARRELQQLKHADTGAGFEEGDIRRYYDAIVSALTLITKVCWRIVEESDKVESIRMRLSASEPSRAR